MTAQTFTRFESHPIITEPLWIGLRWACTSGQHNLTRLVFSKLLKLCEVSGLGFDSATLKHSFLTLKHFCVAFAVHFMSLFSCKLNLFSETDSDCLAGSSMMLVHYFSLYTYKPFRICCKE